MKKIFFKRRNKRKIREKKKNRNKDKRSVFVETDYYLTNCI